MVIGMMAIEMVGGVYCPLSPRDPQHRLHALLQQTQARLVLVHWLTITKTNHDDIVVSLDIDTVFSDNATTNDTDIDQLSLIKVSRENVAYVVFTSGSTGTPKAVQVRHTNYIQSMHSVFYVNMLNRNDIIIQMAQCSFDTHLQDIFGSLISGATLVMLHPGEAMDFDYLFKVFQQKRITYIDSVPSFLQSLFTYVENCSNQKTLQYLRSMIVGGETFPAKLSSLISNNLNRTSQIWSSYGTAEITIGCTLFLVKATSKTDTVPIGQSLPNYECVVLDEHSQTSLTNQPGELLVGGVGVFAGYLGRDDLTARALIEVNGRLFYRTGDIVRIDDSGLIHYIGRQDHQVKLRGQRIELGEIERCLLSISTISACVVIKWNDDHLVAYVQCSHNIHEQQLREHCQSHLPPHMIPSFFVILEQLPLNVNGKIDRKRLPSPDVSHLSSSAHHTNDDNNEFSQPTNDIEQIIHDMWCDILHQKQISISTSLFTIGGHSLLVMQLFHRYKIDFHLESSSSFSISTFFQHPTIKEHAHLIHQTRNIHTEDVDHHQWLPLHVTRARASYAQERIFLDEHIRFSSSTNTTHYRIHHNIYVIPLLYRLSSSHSHLSISRLRYALHSLIIRHNTLRTALYLDDVDGSIVQECFDQSRISNDMISCRFIVLDLHNNNDKDCERQEIVEDILNQVDLFDLSKGHVINCHLLLGHHPSPEDDDLLNENDWILFTLHHAAFDGASTSIFLRDLALAYDQDENFLVETNALQYIDYSVHEHCMDMTLSRQFWHDQLQGYDLQSRLALPVDRHRASADQRSGLASSIQVTLDDDICTSFLHYASSHHLTLFQLGLATFYAFLFRLTHGHSDLCVSSINANRYRNELVNI
ncbi:hypothetical protein I4U23_005690 [Adineta vaga]|nr:hypothetical protein I4U23_005690 [Adineta vaga]